VLGKAERRLARGERGEEEANQGESHCWEAGRTEKATAKYPNRGLASLGFILHAQKYPDEMAKRSRPVSCQVAVRDVNLEGF
jgi:hypothetical protein